jgi:5-methylcytosine-specific restriction enzyme A
MSRYTGPSQAVLELVKARNGGMCLRCGLFRGSQCHHRKPRGMGGTTDPAINHVTNLTWICGYCHTHIESHRSEAYRDGWLAARTANPEQQYLIDSHHRMLMLTADGGVVSNQLPHDYDEVPF